MNDSHWSIRDALALFIGLAVVLGFPLFEVADCIWRCHILHQVEVLLAADALLKLVFVSVQNLVLLIRRLGCNLRQQLVRHEAFWLEVGVLETSSDYQVALAHSALVHAHGVVIRELVVHVAIGHIRVV